MNVLNNIGGKMKHLLLTLMVAFSFSANAEVRYLALGYQTGDIDVDGDTFDVSDISLDFIGTNGNIIFSTGVGAGTVDDVYGYDLDFVSQDINLGYAFGDLTEGSFVLGASYVSGEIQVPGSSNYESSETDAYIGYAKMSGEDVDYSITLSDGVFSAMAFVELGEGNNLRASIGFANSDDMDALSFGLALKF